MLTKIIMDRLEALERDNVSLKSQLRELKKPLKEKPQIINNIIKKDGLTKDDINKMICDKIPKQDVNKLTESDVRDIIKSMINLVFVNKLYGKK